jgi:hypothetical protein
MEQEWVRVWVLVQQLATSQPREESRVGSPSNTITSTQNSSHHNQNAYRRKMSCGVQSTFQKAFGGMSFGMREGEGQEDRPRGRQGAIIKVAGRL